MASSTFPRPIALSLLLLAACAVVALSGLHGRRDAEAQQADLQTSLFLLPTTERPPQHYTGKWSNSPQPTKHTHRN
jgi:hypothetical protein